MADRHRRVLGIDVDGRHVEVELGRERRDVEARDAAHLDAQAGLEGELDPVRVGLGLEAEGLAALDLDQRALLVVGDGDGDGEDQAISALHQRVVGPHDARADHVALAAQQRLLAAREGGLPVLRCRAEEAEGALASAQIRHAHPR